jgi:transcriptional regulator with XRE-family HTH domain
VAERAGISKGMLSNYERGKQCPSLPALVKILNQLHCSVEDFGRILVAAAHDTSHPRSIRGRDR